jgi:predicted transcriptional regulator
LRLEHFGFAEVYDYVDGKADWLAADLPYEGEGQLIGPVMRRGVDRCLLDDSIGDVRARLRAVRSGRLPVVDANGVVMGLLGLDALEADDAERVEALMREGPATVRPSEEIKALSERMQRASVETILVTDSFGRLLGAFDA